MFVLALAVLLSSSFVLAAEGDAAVGTTANTAIDSTTDFKTDAYTAAEVKSDESSSDSNAPSEFADAQLEVGAGITPDSTFYFIEDKILTRFRDDSENREKKIAELREMAKDGNYEDARQALNNYKEYADKLEHEVSPESKKEAQRSASAIRNALKEIDSDIPADRKKEFVEDVKAQEGRIEKAADVAAKIKELCQTLSTLDPQQYAKTCRTGNDAPKWQKDLDEKLTDEQKKEAEAFFGTMSQCFEDPKSCQCNSIKIEKFADACSQIAPLAAKCEEGDEDACAQMDEIEDPIELLPPHLQKVMERLDGRYSDDKFEHAGPPECKKAGVTSREECMKIMFKKHAPEECIAAAESGKIKFTSERTMRESCERIMFEENAPQECIEAGLTDHRECGRYMFEQNAPEECIQAGLTGESPKDQRKCQEIMNLQEGEGSNRGSGKGFGLGRNCNELKNKDEKLKCFEEVFSSVQEGGFQGRGPSNQFGGEFNDDSGGRGGSGRSQGKGNFPEQCAKAGATTPDACQKVMRAEGEKRHQQTREFTENFAQECRAKGGAWDCSFGDIDSSNPCRCYQRNEGENYGGYPRSQEGFRPPEGFHPPEGFKQPPEGFRPPQGSNECRDSQGNSIPCGSPSTPQQPPQGGECRDSTGKPVPCNMQQPPRQDGQMPPQQGQPQPSAGNTPTPQQNPPPADQKAPEQSAPTPTPSTTPAPAPAPTPITGGVIAGDNAFLGYFYR